MRFIFLFPTVGRGVRVYGRAGPATPGREETPSQKGRGAPPSPRTTADAGYERARGDAEPLTASERRKAGHYFGVSGKEVAQSSSRTRQRGPPRQFTGKSPPPRYQ